MRADSADRTEDFHFGLRARHIGLSVACRKKAQAQLAVFDAVHKPGDDPTGDRPESGALETGRCEGTARE